MIRIPPAGTPTSKENRGWTVYEKKQCRDKPHRPNIYCNPTRNWSNLPEDPSIRNQEPSGRGEVETNKASIEVFGIGQCSLDYIGKIQAYPPPDRKCEFTDMVIQGGGPVATALVALARWGVSCAFAGVLGDDLFGR